MTSRKKKKKNGGTCLQSTFCDKLNLPGHFPQAYPIAEDLGH